MFAVIGGSLVAYVVVLIAVGIYVAIRAKSGRDYFASDGLNLAAVIAFALLSAIPTDVLTFLWLGVVRNFIDVTGGLNLFLAAIAPVVTAIVAVQALLLSRAYRARPLLHGGIYLGVYAAAHAFWLNLLFNPTEDIARYAATILIFGFLVMAIIGRFVWLRPVAVADSA